MCQSNNNSGSRGSSNPEISEMLDVSVCARECEDVGNMDEREWVEGWVDGWVDGWTNGEVEKKEWIE